MRYQPKEMILFSLDPSKKKVEIVNTKEETLFHQYMVLGSTNIITRKDQNIIADEIENAGY